MVEIVIIYPQNQKGKGVTVMKIAMPYQDGVLPVSYTHLDVYKRQLVRLSMMQDGVEVLLWICDGLEIIGVHKSFDDRR